MQMIENLVSELFYELSDSVHYDSEYREREEDVSRVIKKLIKENGKGSMVDAYLKDVAEGKIDEAPKIKELANNHKMDTIISELENAIDNRQLRAMEFTCRESFLYGISFCNQIREMNLFNFKQEKEILK